MPGFAFERPLQLIDDSLNFTHNHITQIIGFTPGNGTGITCPVATPVLLATALVQNRAWPKEP